MGKLRSAEALVKDSFRQDEVGRKLTGLALLSLRIAIKAFLSTYHAMRYRLHTLDAADENGPRDDLHSTDYKEHFAEAVVHFQHFSELAIKDMLRALHPLLADKVPDKEVLAKVLADQPVTFVPDPKNPSQSAEFGVVADRLYKLIGAGKIDARYHFVAQFRDALRELTTLRNRLLHRGTVVMRYQAADEFVGGYILPFVLQVVQLDEYKDLSEFWRARPLQCGIDVIRAIADGCAAGAYILKRTAYLKELGRASYANPVPADEFDELIGPPHRSNAQLIAAEAKKHGTDVHVCPVCGIESLITSYDAHEVDVGAHCHPIMGDSFPSGVRCINCTFEVDSELYDKDVFGLPIPAYF